MTEPCTCITAHYDLRLIARMAVLALFTSWTALGLFERAATPARRRSLWLIGAGLILGAGAWVLHFMAALAFRVPFPLGMAVTPTLASLVIGVGGGIGGFALVLAGPPGRGWRPLGGAVVGLAMGAMHLIGLAGLRFAGELRWDPRFAAASGLIAAIAAAAATVAIQAPRPWRHLTATVLLAAGLTGMVVAAMPAVALSPMAVPVPSGLLGPTPLTYAVLAAVAPILLGALVLTAMDQERARRTEVEMRRFRQFADATFEGILLLRDGVIADTNRTLCDLADAEPQQIIGRPAVELLPALAELPNPWPRGKLETALSTPTGSRRPVEVLVGPLAMDGPGVMVVAVRDISERKEAARRIAFLAHHDSLTGLPNRALFNDRLAQALATAERSGGKVALLYLDLDGFKAVNDIHGHPMGDLLLREVADRFATEVREMDTLARLGGDEFAIVQSLGAQPAAAAAMARRLVEMLEAPFDLNGARVTIGVSVGISVFPDDARAAEMLLRRADLALLRAKRDGRGRFGFFEPEMDRRQISRRLLEGDLRTAIAENWFELHYQPLLCTRSRAVVGHEALLRWTHPTRGPIPPEELIALAEETGLIVPLGRWVLERACAEAAIWPEAGTVSVNLSPTQLGQGDVVEMVAEILRRTGLPPARLDLEVTEGILIRNTERALEVLRGFKALGVGVTLDDFGTGYSGLGYLHRFPFDAIKIDRSFIRGLGTDRESGMIVHSILALCRSLNLRVTAEGVETEAQFTILQSYGCDLVQGYLLGQPISADRLRISGVAEVPCPSSSDQG